MSTTVRKVRGRPFEPGNGGRPRGAKNKTTRIIEQLAEGQAEQLIQKVLQLAAEGNVACLRMVLERVWPARKTPPLDVNMPRIKSSTDVLPAIMSIWRAIREGRLTPDEASALSPLIDRSIKAIELQEFGNRLQALENAPRKADEKKSP